MVDRLRRDFPADYPAAAPYDRILVTAGAAASLTALPTVTSRFAKVFS